MAKYGGHFSYAEGGEVKGQSMAARALDAVVPHLKPEWFPTSGRVLVESLQGDKSDITERHFSPEELGFMRGLIQHKGGDAGSIQYPDYQRYHDELYKKGAGMVWSRSPGLSSMGDAYGNVQTTLGRFGYAKQPDGTYRVTDSYDFNPMTDGAAETVQGLMGPYGIIRAYAGDKLPPGKGRKVSVNVGKLDSGQ